MLPTKEHLMLSVMTLNTIDGVMRSNDNPNFWEIKVESFLCPSFDGDETISASTSHNQPVVMLLQATMLL